MTLLKFLEMFLCYFRAALMLPVHYGSSGIVSIFLQQNIINVITQDMCVGDAEDYAIYRGLTRSLH